MAPEKDTSALGQANSELLKAAERLINVQSRSILIVEDTAAHAAMMKRSLKSEHWESQHVTRGSEALQRLRENENQIVLLDLSLPDFEGTDLVRDIVALDSMIPVIVVTAQENVDTSVEAMKRGAWDYVVKAEPKATQNLISQAVEKAWQNRVREAERELAEKTKVLELIKSERLETIEIVIRTVCHEVNNPLSGVLALSQLLSQKEHFEEDDRRLIDGIAQSASEVAKAVQKLRTITDQAVNFGGQKILDSKNDPEK